MASLCRAIFPGPAATAVPTSTKFHAQRQLSSSFSNMATAVADDIVRDEEPHEVQFADFVDEEEEFAGFDEDDVRQSDKDSTEEELERLVFGDSARFRAELKKARQVATIEGQWEREDEEQEGETGLESAQDADVRLYLSRRHVDD